MQAADSQEKHPFSPVEKGSRNRYNILPKLMEYIMNQPQEGDVRLAVEAFEQDLSVENLDRLFLSLFAPKGSLDRHDHAISGYFRHISWKNEEEMMTMDELTHEFVYSLHFIRLITFREIQKSPHRKAEILQMVNPK